MEKLLGYFLNNNSEEYFMVLSQKQKNELLTGIRLATELKSSSENLKKFLVISAYQYNSDRKIIKLNRILNKIMQILKFILI